VRRAFPSRFSEWTLEPEGAMHLELLQFGWVGVNRALSVVLGSDFSATPVQSVDGLHHSPAAKHQGWSTD